MKKTYRIIVLDAETLGQVQALETLKNWGEVTVHSRTDPAEVASRIAKADIVVTNKVVLTSSDLERTSALKLICVAATGMNNVDLEAAAKKNIPVKNVKGYSTYGVAQQTIAAILSLVHRLPFLDAYVKRGLYSQGHLFTYIHEDIVELKGKTFGIIGLGDIGKQVAKIATALGCEVIYYSTSGKNNDKEYKRVDWQELLMRSDVLSVHAPLNVQTKGLIDYVAMSEMKPTAILHNAGRGGIVIEEDLCRALKENKIGLAALDVYAQEPLPPESPLLDPALTDRLLLTPHTAWAAKESRERLICGVIENIKEWEGKISGQ
ncbi:MAG TPA: D-2-hydroxyacid dehydrogenase [Cytophagaceae bacterium]|jgi:lactate dehydrogenase-like 2-hydroxyacid dehydrogenase|nr:D-2-hydroxyacid dehydrogenase [Cytophagaceae bacterium]